MLRNRSRGSNYAVRIYAHFTHSYMYYRYAQGSRRLVVQVKVHVVVPAERRYNETSRNARPIGLRSFVRQTSSLPAWLLQCNQGKANLSCHYTFFSLLYIPTTVLRYQFLEIFKLTFLFVKFEVLFVNNWKKLIYRVSRNSRVILLQHFVKN